MSTWDDLYKQLDRQPDATAPQRTMTAAIPKASWPPLLSAMFDDPKRPRALGGDDVYRIETFVIDGWLAAETTEAKLPEYNPTDLRWKAWDDARLRSLGYKPGEIASGAFPLDFRRTSYVQAIERSVHNVLNAEMRAEDGSDDNGPDLNEVIPDGGATIEEIADAMGVSRRTAEARVKGLDVIVVETPNARGGKPRKRYFRPADPTRPSDDDDDASDET
jgi:hypothetical protein